MSVAFVTGGSGTVGRALIARLVEDGTRVLALARSRQAAGVVESHGAEPVWGDLERPEGWAPEARAADRVWHLGLPRLSPPVREIGVRRLARRAAADAAAVRTALGDRPLVVVSTALAWGDRTDGPAGEDDPERPLALALPALAAERALAHPGLRVVRLPWVYGDGGLLHQVGWALAHGRYRVVGPGDNRWALISAEDAAEALILAADADPGVYAVAEPDAPTQGAVVAAFCSRPGVRRPDHVPVGLASLAMGRAMSRALAASLELRPGRLADLGWSPSADWRRDLLSRTGRPRPGAG